MTHSDRNALIVIDPINYRTTQLVDFTKAGITQDGMTSNGRCANTAGVQVDPNTNQVFVSHPYSDQITILDRVGEVPDIGDIQDPEGWPIPAPEESTGEEPETPEAGDPAEAPKTAVQADAGALSWAISEYTKTFSTRFAFKPATFASDGTFTFADGEGWYDEKSGRLYAQWGGSVQYKPYGSTAPVEFVFANPELTVSAEGRGSLSFDVRWNNGAGKTSEFERVEVATFEAAVKTAGGKATISATPDYAGREYTNEATGKTHASSFPQEFIDFLDPDIRAWWFESGASLDRLKPPTVLDLSFTLAKGAPDPDPEPEVPGKPAAVKFSDMQKGDKFYTEISWMASEGISTGVKQPNGTFAYQPKNRVTREAMAAFLYRLYAPKNYVAPKVSPFADVKPGQKFYTEIAWMYQSKTSTGITQSSGKPKFQPKSGITREAMAAFMYRLDTGKKPAAPKASPFADVRKGNKFYTEIAWMSQSGLSTGISQGMGRKPIYAAKNNVTREAMAAFLYRAES
jgi:hypothetical protein